LTALIQKERKM